MVSESFNAFFTATAGASGALVGLLFVAISVSHQNIMGANATVSNRIRASTALTALVTPLVLSLLALIPDVGVRVPAIVAGALGLIFAASALRRLLESPEAKAGSGRSLSILISFIVVMSVEIGFGVVLQFAPHYEIGVVAIAGAMVASLGIGIDRAWELVGGRRYSITTSVGDLIHGEPPTSPDAPPAAGDKL